jgi:uncharacterized coiled-coil DUF342 family protein
MFIGNQKTFHEVFRQHTGYVSDKWVQYLFIYDQLFERFLCAGKPITLLEIGVQNGGSLEIWKKYLPKNSKIYGVDINEKCADLQFSENISFYLGNATDTDFMNQTFGGMEFDVILDDGSHICQEVIETFINLFPKIKLGGMYLIEDLHTSYWKDYGGGLRASDSSIAYFKGLIDALNTDYIENDPGIDTKYLAALKNYNELISSISFFDSICAVNKLHQSKTNPYEAVITGQVETVCDVIKYKPYSTEQVKLLEKVQKMYDRNSPENTVLNHPDNELKQEYAALSQSFDKLNQQYVLIRRRYDALNQELSTTLQTLENNKQYADTLKGELNDTKQYTETLKKELSDTKQYVETLKGELNDIRQYVETLKKELEDTRQYIETLKKELSDTRQYVEILKEELNDTRQYVHTLQRDLGDMHKKLGDTQRELENTKDQRNRLQESLNMLQYDPCDQELQNKRVLLPYLVKSCVLFPWYVYKTCRMVYHNPVQNKSLALFIKAYLFMPYFILKTYKAIQGKGDKLRELEN